MDLKKKKKKVKRKGEKKETCSLVHDCIKS